MKVLKLHNFIILLLVISLTVPNISLKAKNNENAFVKGEIIISLQEDSNIGSIITEAKSSGLMLNLKDSIDNIALLEYKNSMGIQSVIELLNQYPEVIDAQPNYIMTAFELTNDEYIGSQWPIENPGSYISYYGGLSYQDLLSSASGIDLEVGKAWEAFKTMSFGSREVIVALIDTGIDYQHPDLLDHMWTNPNEIPGDGIDNDNNGYIDDVYGWDFYNNDNTTCHYKTDKDGNMTANPKDSDDHGTHCAGIIAATADNGIGIAGIASNVNVKIMTIKALGGGSSYSPGSGSTYDIIKAIKYAASMGADICNMSWGHSNYNPIMQQTLRQSIEESDMLFVAASGNNGQNNDKLPLYPASYNLDNLISVASVNASGQLSEFSNYGKSSVDIAAPGEDILSTVVGSYRSSSGTSMAAPHVSAVAAILYSCYDKMYPSNVKEIITNNTTSISALSSYVSYPGIVSAYKTLLSNDAIKTDDEAPTIKFKTTYVKTEISVALTPKDSGDSQIRTIKYMAGKKKAADFKRGTEGITITNNKLKLTKGGNYTFYISDYAGNESVYVQKIAADTTAPTIKTSYIASNNYKTFSINVKLTDNESGVKTVKYAKGTQTTNYFKAAANGTKISVSKGQAKFKVNASGKYTIYAVDYAGNKSVKTINVKR